MSPTNSEAEPAEEGVRENGGEVVEQVEANQQQEDVSPPASVQSSEEARVEGRGNGVPGERGGGGRGGNTSGIVGGMGMNGGRQGSGASG